MLDGQFPDVAKSPTALRRAGSHRHRCGGEEAARPGRPATSTPWWTHSTPRSREMSGA